MKLKLYLVVLALFVSACGFFGGPSSVAKNWISYVQGGKYEEAFKLFSSEYVKQKGADKVKTDMQQFHQEIESNKQRTGSFSIEKHNEIVEGNTARVHFILRGGGENNSVGIIFVMVKENGEWKIKKFD